ncbi:MAG: hypothetical protein EOP09_14635 [Proteobacteria bacterium]|nr:MAG: hypothetical protein EOP09_14635 [Pseudomonadota bacterium]
MTGTTYDRLWKKAGSDVRWNDDWTYKSLRECLSDWEYKFLIAAMFDGVVSNGGLMHGMACFFDAEKGEDDRLTPDELIVAFKEIGSRNNACAIEAAVAALKKAKLSQFDEASGSDYEAIESAISKAYTTFKEHELEVLFYSYIQKKTRIEQAGADQPATRSESKSEGNQKPQPEADGRSR